MRRHSVLVLPFVLLSTLACGSSSSEDSGTLTTSGQDDTTDTGSGDGDGDPGDGDGDGEPGDGDGEPTTCGDGVLQADEECDAGDGNSESGQCTPGCLIARCGDTYVYTGFEDCDDGNLVNTDDCLDSCVAASCGDGFVHAGVEACDDANQDDTDECNQMCLPSTCGDGVLQGNEQCDDSNMDTSDSCPACQPSFCGDGYVQLGTEACDDGNDQSDDGCIAETCVHALCGDGIVWEGVEACDDGNESNSDACPSCEPAACGDGFKWVGMEECDDADMIDDDGCSNSCIASSTYVFLTSANGEPGFHRYSIVDDMWATMTNPPSTTRSQIANDGNSVFLMGSNDIVYEYDPINDSWSELMNGPGGMTSEPIGFFQWVPNGFYYLQDGTSTMYLYRNGQWNSFDLGAPGSCAGTYDADQQELYIRGSSVLGFRVIDTTIDSVVRVIDTSGVVNENSRTGSYVDGHFYSRTSFGPFQRFDAIDGTQTTMTATPPEHTATDTDFVSGLIYVAAGYGNLNTGWQVYDPANDQLTTLAPAPLVANHSSITVMRP